MTFKLLGIMTLSKMTVFLLTNCLGLSAKQQNTKPNIFQKNQLSVYHCADCSMRWCCIKIHFFGLEDVTANAIFKPDRKKITLLHSQVNF
jgi:hypothetical protein